MNKRLAKAREAHEAWLEARNLSRSQIKKRRDPKIKIIKFPDYKIQETVPLGNGFANGGFQNSMMSNRFKESPKVRLEIEQKAMQIAPAYNKGPVMFVPATEVKYIGKK